MSITNTTVSVVIPVKNGMQTLKRCLDGIMSQTVAVNEIVVIDSGSTDGTLDLLSQYSKVKLLEIKPETFNHGATRNLGVDAATGEMVVLTVQDAWPVNNNWLADMLNGFTEPDVVAVTGQQVVPHERDKNPIRWFRAYSVPRVITQKLDKETYIALSPEEKRQICSWDDVNAMYKREVLLTLPFRQTRFAEDAFWAQDAIMAGYKIAYNYAARVYHYHHENAEQAFKRSFAEMYSMYKIFGLMPTETKLSTAYYIQLAKGLVKASGISLQEKVGWWNYNITLKKSYNKAVALFNKELAAGEQQLDSCFERLY